MQTSLVLTALLMGLLGGPHCIAMCGAACAGIGHAAGAHKTSAMWIFQAGRVVGYAALGALAASSMQVLGWLTTQSAALRPVWTLFHVAAAVLGLLLVWKAEQPIWLQQAGKKLWMVARSLANGRGKGAPLLIGALWSLLPCGLLYSALLVAALTGKALEGAMVMALFALGTSLAMMAGPWLWLQLRWRGRQVALSGAASGNWGVRLAGVALAASSAWGLWMGFAHNTAPWCVTP